ncbi:HAD-IA family hydrolase [Arenimonas sp.]|uniref:HAD-IA family hydrolase n=1 Tax=Arenimonas sp. TaxID=1872635 RepID=UPI0039E5D3A2
MNAASSPSPAYALAIFDFDGTLADSFPFFLRLHNELARKHGFREVAPQDVPALRAMSTRELMARSGLPAWRLPVVARDFTRRMQEADEVRLFDGAGEALHALASAGLRLALVTSNSRPNIDRVLGPELCALFGHIDCGASIFGKRSRLLRAARVLGTKPEACIYVGDATADAEAAREAGMDFGAVDWGYTTPEALALMRPARRFGQVRELLSLAG